MGRLHEGAEGGAAGVRPGEGRAVDPLPQRHHRVRRGVQEAVRRADDDGGAGAHERAHAAAVRVSQRHPGLRQDRAGGVPGGAVAVPVREVHLGGHAAGPGRQREGEPHLGDLPGRVQVAALDDHPGRPGAAGGVRAAGPALQQHGAAGAAGADQEGAADGGPQADGGGDDLAAQRDGGAGADRRACGAER